MAISGMTERVGQVLGGRYRLISPVGRGASGEVFVAEDVVLRRRVAVKVLHSALSSDDVFLRRFRAEAQAAAALNHPNVMAVFDWGHDAEPYLVTEFLAGGSLRAMLDAGHLLSVAQTVQVGLEAARGLGYAHRRGFIHRDIKPANLLFDDEARLRIADFGLARALAESAWTEPTGAVLGTARYASPEQAKGETLDGRSDIYSLALTLVEAATGTVPFTADTPIGTLMARVDQPLRLDDLPAGTPALGALGAVLEEAGAPDPSQRPDAVDFIDRLTEVLATLEPAEPLPLVGTAVEGLGDGVPGDGETAPTLVAGAGAGAGAVRLASSSGMTLDADSSDATPLARPTRKDKRRARRSADAAARLDDALERDRLDSDARLVKKVTPASATLVAGSLVVHSGDPGEVDHARSASAPELFDQDAHDDLPPDDRLERVESGSEPRARRKVAMLLLAVALVAAVAAAGVAWRQREVSSTTEMPDLVGQTQAEAASVIRQHEWVVDWVEEYSESRPSGLILAQDPLPGVAVEDGSSMSLTVSKGPAPVPVPDDVPGMTVADATERLADAGLVLVEAAHTFDEQVPKGSVIAYAPDTPPEVPRGGEVNVIVSDGAAPRVVPDLSNLTLEEATTELAGLGLGITSTKDYSETIEEGKVIDSTPSWMSTVDKGDVITVKISLGPPLVPIPADIVGMTPSQAADALEKVDLCVSDTEGPPNKPVTGTTPKVGTEVKPGTCVVIITR